MDIDYKIVGSRLRDARMARGLTQAQVAKKLHVTAAAVSAIERGVSKPNMERLDLFAQAVGLELELELFDPTDPARLLGRRLQRLLPTLTNDARATLAALMDLWESRISDEPGGTARFPDEPKP